MQLLTEFDSRKLLQKYKIPVPKAALAKTKEDALKAAEAIGCPVVMKVMSPDILHKTEAKTVTINVQKNEVVGTFEELLERARKFKPSASIQGVLVEETTTGQEVILGGKDDDQFGPVVLFGGLGGIYVELLKDVSFRVAPLTFADAMDMIEETKGSKLLHGFRGLPKDIPAVAETLVKLSQMMVKEDVAEMDINPLIVREKGCVAVDARIVLND